MRDSYSHYLTGSPMTDEDPRTQWNRERRDVKRLERLPNSSGSLFRATLSRIVQRSPLVLVGLLCVVAVRAEDLAAGGIPVIRIGVENNSPPLSFENADGEAVGFSPELLVEMEKTGRVRFEIVSGYWSDILRQFKAGEIDALANVIETEERRAVMLYSIPHVSLHGVTYTRPEDPPITHSAQFAGKKISTLNGTMSYLNAVNHEGWGGEIVGASRWQDTLLAVKEGRCDVALLTRPLKFEQPDEMGLHREFVTDVHHWFHLVVQPGNTAALERINAALAEVLRREEFDQLYAKWIGPIEPRPIRFSDLRPYRIPILLVIIFVLTFMGYYLHAHRRLSKETKALTASNVTRIRQAELLDRTGQLAKVGGWEIEVETKQLSWTLETFRISEIAPPNAPSVEEGIALYAVEARPIIEQAVETLINTGEPYDLELPFITAKGRHRWVNTQGFADRQNGKTVRLYGTFQDITERRKVEGELAAVNQKFRDLVDSTDGVVWEADATSYVFTFVSSNVERVLGYRAAEWLQPGFWASHIHEDDRDESVAVCLAHTARMEDHSLQYRFIAGDGRLVWVRDEVRLIRAGGKVQSLRGLMIDITEQKRLEAEAVKSEARFRAVFNHAPVGISLTTKDEVVFVNAEHSRITGVSVGNAKEPDAFTRATHPDDREQQVVAARKFVAGEVEHYTVEKRYVHPSGRVQWAELTSRFLPGAVAGEQWIVTTLTDINERKRSQTQLQRSESRFRSIFEEAPLGIATIDSASGEILQVNAQFATIVGRSILDTEAINWQSITNPGDLLEDLDQMARLNAAEISGFQMDKRYRRPDGTYVWINMTIAAAVVVDPQRPRHLCMIIDITERKNTELALYASEERFRLAVLKSPFPIMLHAEDGAVIQTSNSWCEISGYDSKEIRTVSDWSELAYGEQYAPALERIEALYALTESRAEGDYPIRTKSGAVRIWDFHSAGLGRLPDGRRLVISMAMDVTERRAGEMELQQSLLEKEALLKEVHHRVKNNLQVITSLLRLEGNRRLNSEVKGALGDMQGRIRSMALLHETLYRTGNYARVDLGEYLRQLATQLFRANNSSPARIRLRLAMAKVFVGIDQAIPCGLIVNELIANSLKHGFPHESSGQVCLEIKVGEGDEVHLRVRDDGIGLAEDFDISKTESLGLRLVSDLTHQLQGTLEMEPTNGFLIRFTPSKPRPNGETFSRKTLA